MWLTAFIDLPAAAVDDDVTFWLAATATTLSSWRGEHLEFASLLPEGGDPWLRVQRLGSGTGRIHLDLHVDDPPAFAARAAHLGASSINDDPVPVFASPAGVVFCVVEEQLSRSAPTPAWPHHSRVDQVSLDIPDRDFAVEAAFWRDLTGRAVTPSPIYQEFARLDWRPEDSLKILLQRCGDDGRARAHLDLATTDRAAEVARLIALGATEVRHTPHWTTLRDPAGLEFCVTTREPTA